MSAVNDIAGVQNENCIIGSGHSEEFTVLTGRAINQRFTCRDLDQISPFDGDFLLGKSPMMRDVLRIPTGMVSGLQLQDVVRRSDGTRYKILELLGNNASTVTTDYLVEQQL